MKLATICFLIKDRKVLLAEKKIDFGKGFLNGYGGKVKEGETPESAAARELAEEAGVTTDPAELEKVAAIDFFEGDVQIFECHVFYAREWRGEPGESEEMAAPQWFSLDAIPYDRMWKADREWLPLVFSGEKIHAKARYKAGMKEISHFSYTPL